MSTAAPILALIIKTPLIPIAHGILSPAAVMAVWVTSFQNWPVKCPSLMTLMRKLGNIWICGQRLALGDNVAVST